MDMDDEEDVQGAVCPLLEAVRYSLLAPPSVLFALYVSNYLSPISTAMLYSYCQPVPFNG